MKAKENWTNIHNHNPYEVSDLGRVKNTRSGLILASRLYGCGYCGVQLHGEENYIHRLVATAFIGSIPAGFHVNHLNFDRTDNRLINLECVTPKQNAQHAHLHIWYVSQTKIPGFESGVMI